MAYWTFYWQNYLLDSPMFRNFYFTQLPNDTSLDLKTNMTRTRYLLEKSNNGMSKKCILCVWGCTHTHTHICSSICIHIYHLKQDICLTQTLYSITECIRNMWIYHRSGFLEKRYCLKELCVQEVHWEVPSRTTLLAKTWLLRRRVELQLSCNKGLLHSRGVMEL